MKSKTMFIALYSVAFMFPSIGSVDTAGVQTDISHCAAFSGPPKAACEAAANQMGAPNSFDDGLMGTTGMNPAPGMAPGYAPGTAPAGAPMLDVGNAAAARAIDDNVDIARDARIQKCIVDNRGATPKGQDEAAYCASLE